MEPVASELPDRLPHSVCEVLPNVLYVGAAAAAPEMVRRWNVRFVVRCMEEPASDVYQHELDSMWVAKCRQQQQQQQQQHNAMNSLRASAGGKAPKEEDDAACCTEQPPCTADVPDEDGSHRAPPADDNPRDASAVERALPCDDPSADAAELLTQRPEAYTVRVLHCPLEDTMKYSLLDSDAFHEALRFLDEALAQCGSSISDEDQQADGEAGNGGGVGTGGGFSEASIAAPPAVFVHCLAGRSRSPALVLAFLITRQRMPLQEALDMLAPTMRPNPNFIRQLMALEAEVLDSEPLSADTKQARQQPPFDLRQYFIDGLTQMHPSLSEAAVVSAVDGCGGDIEVARLALTKAAFEASRHKAAVACLCQMLRGAAGGQAVLSEATVTDVYEACHRNRHLALQRLLQMHQAASAEVDAIGDGSR